MASGKTTFGEALAEKLGIDFIDLDNFIEKTQGKKISDIFRENGEEHFRKLEKECLEKVTGGNEDCVVACGGGTPCFFDNMDILNNTGITVFLETSTPVLISRLQEESESRPQMCGKTDDEIREKVLTQLCERLPVYMEAKLKWNGDELDTEQQIKDNVENFMSSYPSIFR